MRVQSTTYGNTPFFFGYDQRKTGMRSKKGLDYTTFGAPMPGRSYSSTTYRFGFNGKENDGETSTQDYGMRIYNPALGRFLSVDPLAKNFAWYTPYQFAGNMPIWAIDLDGAEPVPYQNIPITEAPSAADQGKTWEYNQSGEKIGQAAATNGDLGDGTTLSQYKNGSGGYTTYININDNSTPTGGSSIDVAFDQFQSVPVKPAGLLTTTNVQPTVQVSNAYKIQAQVDHTHPAQYKPGDLVRMDQNPYFQPIDKLEPKDIAIQGKLGPIGLETLDAIAQDLNNPASQVKSIRISVIGFYYEGPDAREHYTNSIDAAEKASRNTGDYLKSKGVKQKIGYGPSDTRSLGQGQTPASNPDIGIKIKCE